MRLCLILLTILIGTVPGVPVNKSKYDLPEGLGKQSIKAENDRGIIHNDQIEATLINGGYLTIGTTGGSTASPLDNNCGILFGHPFAKTTYPLYSIDGKCGRIERFAELDAGSIISNDASLTFSVSSADNLVFDLTVIVSEDKPGTLTIIQGITNAGHEQHTVQAAFILDPALGNRAGDGAVFSSAGTRITQQSALH
jgi:hypothetical protein